MTITSIIRDQIRNHPRRAIPFARFMELALYHPEGGYYMSARPKVGRDGDFFTSATVHPVFAETLADVVAEMWQSGGWTAPALVEIGGGTGALSGSMLRRLRETVPELYRDMRLVLIETSPYHRQLQQEVLRDAEVETRWYSSLREAAAEGVEGVILSNEWLDAFPVHVVEKTADGWREVWVTETDGGFAEVLGELTFALEDSLQEMDESLPRGMRIEVNTAMEETAADLSRLLRQGYVLTVDYGDVQEELYHPARKRGTLMCYHRHQAHDNPYVHVGEQDITAHVNFSAWMRAGERTGLKTLAYMRQDRFLIKCGLLEKAVAHADTDPFTSEAMKRNRAIQQLIYPGGLGGLFRVLVQAKAMPDGVPLSFLR